MSCRLNAENCGNGGLMIYFDKVPQLHIVYDRSSIGCIEVVVVVQEGFISKISQHSTD
jgi:hypothetical protein